MIFIQIEPHLSSLLTFNNEDKSEAELKGILNGVYKIFIEFWNSSEDKDPYYYIDHLNRQIKNKAVEAIFEDLLKTTTHAYRSRFYDKRIKLKLKMDPGVKCLTDAKFYFMQMDLDLTLEMLKDDEKEEVPISELIDENPDADTFERLQNI